MISRKLLLCFWLLISNFILVAQDINWSKAVNWKIYDINKRVAFQTPVDSLSKFKNINLGDIRIMALLGKVIALPKDKSYVWMGIYVASCELEPGQVRKVILSNYGGFFYDEKTKLYYELPEDLRREWLDYLNEKVAELMAK